MNDLDINLVRSLQFTPLTNPDAQNKCTTTSLVFAPSCEWDVVIEMFEIAYPAVFIGGTLADYRDYIPMDADDPDLRRVQRRKRLRFDRVLQPFLAACDSRDISLGPGVGSETMYWRR